MERIVNTAEYEAIMQRIDELVELIDDSTNRYDKNYVELDILTDLVIAYEKMHDPVKGSDWAEAMKRYMFEMDLNQTQFAYIIGMSYAWLSKYLTG